MVEDALAIATDLDYKFDLAIQLGRLETAKVKFISSLLLDSVGFTFTFSHVLLDKYTNIWIFT